MLFDRDKGTVSMDSLIMNQTREQRRGIESDEIEANNDQYQM